MDIKSEVKNKLKFYSYKTHCILYAAKIYKGKNFRKNPGLFISEKKCKSCKLPVNNKDPVKIFKGVILVNNKPKI